MDKYKNEKLDMITNILDLQLKKHDDAGTFVRLTRSRGCAVNHSSWRVEMVSDILKK